MTFKQRRQGGFTLIEVMITVAIVAILAAVALPSYTEYVRRGAITDGINTLANLRVQMEQFYQDNRTYAGGACSGACGVACPSTGSFTYACAVANAGQTYTLTATGTTGSAAATFTYSVNEQNAWTTIATVWGISSAQAGRIIRKP